MGKVNGIAVSSVAAGTLLVWSGIKGWSILATIGDIVSGKKPTGGEVNGLSSSNSNTGSALGVGSNPSGISADAMKYQGHAYSYGGAPGKNGTSPWDCSSFVNWVIGHDFKGSIPGYANGSYDGSSHGPPTGSWGVWTGMAHVSQSQVQAGDIIVWTGHMGIAISNTQMISALNSQLGTLVTPIQGYGNGPLMCYGRL